MDCMRENTIDKLEQIPESECSQFIRHKILLNKKTDAERRARKSKRFCWQSSACREPEKPPKKPRNSGKPAKSYVYKGTTILPDELLKKILISYVRLLSYNEI